MTPFIADTDSRWFDCLAGNAVDGRHQSATRGRKRALPRRLRQVKQGGHQTEEDCQ
jgi:hypothetical protein